VRVTARRISGARPMKSMATTDPTAHTASMPDRSRVPALPAFTTVVTTSSVTAPEAAPPSRVITALARRIGQRRGRGRSSREAEGAGSLSSSCQRTKLATR